jgi:hypothetical protein
MVSRTKLNELVVVAFGHTLADGNYADPPPDARF